MSSETDLIRLAGELEELPNLNNVVYVPSEDDDITKFDIKLKVFDGLYRNKWFTFHFTIPDGWPYERPDVKILDKIWHPNIESIDEDNPELGRICVSILKANYTPTVRLEIIIEGIKYILVNPNPHDFLNPQAAEDFLADYPKFKSIAEEYLEDVPEDL